MSKRSADSELRRAIVSGLTDAIRKNRLTKSKAAELLGVKRQTLWLYLRGKATPGGDVLRRAFDLWGLRIELGNYVITKESFGLRPEPVGPSAEQLSLLDQLEKISDDQLEVAAMGRRGEYFEFKIRIKATATIKEA
ncbi:MAG: helix-turn-helix transcriptional regulator [Candidatus Acidiferrum sp.]